jgi:CHAD domain-containing protein
MHHDAAVRGGTAEHRSTVAAYRLDLTASPAAELRRIARTQTDRAIVELDLDDADVAVHQIRKRSKKLRALLRLVRPVATELYRDENPRIRDLARDLAAPREHAASVGTLGGLAEPSGDALPVQVVTAVLEGLARTEGEGADAGAALEGARIELVALRSRIETDWTLPEDIDGADAFVPGFRRSYARGRDAFEEALDEPSTEALHEWRKRVKDHWYHCRLLRDLWRPVLAARISALDDLTDLLGDDHDLAVLRTSLLADPDRYGGEVVVGTTTALLDRRRATLQRDAIDLGMRVYADRPKAIARRVTRWHEAALEDAAEPAAPPLVRPGR